MDPAELAQSSCRSCRRWNPSFLRILPQVTFKGVPGTGWDKSSCISEFTSLWEAGKCRADKSKFTLTLHIFKCGTFASRSWGSQGLKIKFFRTATHSEFWCPKDCCQHRFGWFNGYKVVYERSGGDLERAELPIHFSAAFWGHHLCRFSLSCFIYCFLVGHWCYQSQKCELPQCEGTAKQFPFPITLVILLLCKRAAERNNTKNSQHSAFNASCSHYLWPFQCQTGYFEALGVCGNCSFCVDQG